MAFDLTTLVKRFEHIPTAIHAFDEQHKALESDLVAIATKIIPTLPYGQEVENFVSTLRQAGEWAHAAIDKGAQAADAAAGVIRTNDKVVSGGASAPASGAAAASSAGEAETAAGVAPEASTPPASPVAPAEPTLQAAVATNPPGEPGAVTTETGAAATTPSSAPAESAAAPDAEGFIEHVAHEVEDFLHVPHGEKPGV